MTGENRGRNGMRIGRLRRMLAVFLLLTMVLALTGCGFFGRRSGPSATVRSQTDSSGWREKEEPREEWLDGHWVDKPYHFDTKEVYAFALDTPIYECTHLKVAVRIDMKYNTHCEDWRVHVWNGDEWKDIGYLYLPGGNGEGEADIVLSYPMTVSHVVVLPSVNGSYSWDCGMAVCNVT